MALIAVADILPGGYGRGGAGAKREEGRCSEEGPGRQHDALA